MFIWYEDMKKDLTKIIKGVCRFTGYRLTDHKIRMLEEILQIDNFRFVNAIFLSGSKAEVCNNVQPLSFFF